MYVNKQTLFYRGISWDKWVLFDLKTLNKLKFKEKHKAIAFCKEFNEGECVNELINESGHGGNYIYLCTNMKTAKHVVVRTSILLTSRITDIGNDELIHLVKNNEVCNLEIGNSGKIRIKWLIPQAKEEFKQSINKQYNIFVNSMNLLGKDQSFKYVIIGEYVIQTAVYNGKEVIVPEFVTSISAYQYYPKEIKISDGVRFIGTNVVNNVTSIIGGNTIEYIGSGFKGADEPTIIKRNG